MKQKLLAQGAEAKIFLSENIVIKNRIKKLYRIKELDNMIRKRRTKAETKLLAKASEIINTPAPLESKKENQIKIPYIKGKKLSESLDKFPLTKQKQICRQIGKDIAKLHDNHIIHGDLTTSNMIFTKDKTFFIDFGLGYISHRTEDRAVDLHLLKQALEAKHFKNWETLYKEFLKGYKNSKNFDKTISQLKKVEKRRRYKG
jgi:TP53 regulating kinase-like protein